MGPLMATDKGVVDTNNVSRIALDIFESRVEIPFRTAVDIAIYLDSIGYSRPPF